MNRPAKKKKRSLTGLPLSGVLALGVVGLAIAAAAAAGPFEIDWYTIDGGGAGIDGAGAGGPYTLSGTIGQPDARNEAMAGGDYSVVGGFWVPLPAGPSCNPDFDGDGDVDVTDFLTFSTCFNGSLNPPKPICPDPDTDIDGDGDVDVTDFLTYSTCFNGSLNPPKAGCPCGGS